MKNLAVFAGLLALSSTAFGYQERIERNGDQVKASWYSPAEVAVTGESSELVPIAHNFYDFSGDFESKDLTCDQFTAEIHKLISDWRTYPHANFYALSNCSGTRGGPSTTHLLYAIDAWRPEAVAEVQAFLKAHRGLQFQGQTLWFYEVNHLDVKTVLTLGTIKPNGELKPIHAASAWSEASGTDQWYPQNYARSKVVLQTDLDVFLKWVGETCGADEKAPFKEAVAGADFAQFSDFFTIHLENGQKDDFWLGFGASRRCGTQPCFSKAAPKPLD